MVTKSRTNQKGQDNRKPPAGKQFGSSPESLGADARTNSPVLERGDLFFFYRPDVDETSPSGLLDVRRFHLVLRPEGKETLRLVTVGRKKLPEATDEGRSHWAFVDRVFRTPDELREALSGATYETETLGER